MHNITRRDFFKRFGLAVGGAALLPACDFGKAPAATRFRTLTGDEALCLGALCDQIIPPDAGPGATEAGVLDYIDKQTVIRFRQDKAVYKESIERLQTYCNDTHGANFERLDGDVQYKIMQDMEAGRLPEEHWAAAEQRDFFRLVRSRTMQGFYGPPRHGGNKNFISYRMMRLDVPLVVGQNRYAP
jgi:gluconate 2-dehydrogenase gamma chain